MHYAETTIPLSDSKPFSTCSDAMRPHAARGAGSVLGGLPRPKNALLAILAQFATKV